MRHERHERHERHGRVLAVIVWSIVLLVVGVWAVSAILVAVWSRRDESRPAGAIVVLGAAQYVGHPSPVLRARVDHAVDLWQHGLAPVLVLTGGRGPRDTTSEAQVARVYAERQGVPDSVILLETSGRTSEESMRTVADMLYTRGVHDVVLVSDPFHMLRLKVLSARLGLESYTSPTHTSPISANRELVAEYVFYESIKVPFTLVFERHRAR